MLIDELQLSPQNPPLPQVLPETEAPPLHALRVEVPALSAERELTTDRLMELYRARVRETAPRRIREAGEFVQAGDEVLVTLAFFFEGKALPFTCFERELIQTDVPWRIPGVEKKLVGGTVLQVAQLPAAFPVDYPLAWLAGVSGTWRARIHEIIEVSPPDWEDPKMLAHHGIDLEIGAFMEALREEEIAKMALELKATAVDMTLDLLRARSPLKVPSAFVEREIYSRWSEGEGRVLASLGAGESDLHLSVAAWLRDADTFQDAERRIHISALLHAIAVRDGLQLTPEALQDTLEVGAAWAGVAPQAAKAGLRDDDLARGVFERQAFHLVCVEHVMAQVDVCYLEVD